MWEQSLSKLFNEVEIYFELFSDYVKILCFSFLSDITGRPQIYSSKR